MKHGTRWTYLCGCRCADCTDANTTYHRTLRARKRGGEAVTHKLVHRELIDEALNALAEQHSLRELARMAGTTDTTIRRLLAGQENVRLELASRLLSLHEKEDA